MKQVSLLSIVVSMSLLALTGLPASAQGTCLAPAMHVDIFDVSESDDGSGVLSTMLQLTDPNPAARVSGYNIYRSPTASSSPGSWALLAHNAMDEDAATPGVQWSDRSGNNSPTGIYFYLAAAYNGTCDTEGPWMSPSSPDADGDGIADEGDPCPTTPQGAGQLMQGCSATDYLISPELLVHPVDLGLATFLIDNAAASTPVAVLSSVDQAQIALQSVADDLRRATPCAAAPTFGSVVGHLDDVVLLLEEYLVELDGAAGALVEWPVGDDGAVPEGVTGIDGDYVYPSPEYQYWEGQLFKFMDVHASAMQSSSVTDEICSAQGAAVDLSGSVRTISDRERRMELDDGEQIILPWSVAVMGSDSLAEDRPVDISGTTYGNVTLGSSIFTQSSPFPFFGDLTYDGCLRLRILPVQPLPGAPYPQPGWAKHSPEAYRGTDTVLALEAGMQLVTEDNGCPGVVPGLGPGGEDVRIDYYYQLLLSYQPRQGGFVNLAPLAYKATGDSYPIPFPDMDPTVNATLFASKMKRSCIDSGVSLPIFDPESGSVVGFQPLWNCSSEQTVEFDQYTIRVRDAQGYCESVYFTNLFDIEDHDTTDWRVTSITGVSLIGGGIVPAPIVFSAQGDKIVNGVPVSSSLGFNEDFAVYNPFAQTRAGFGTNRRSILDWPHITGTRNAEPFRYTCSLDLLQTDMIQSCQTSPQTFYRMPFPFNVITPVWQGNGGTFSHNGWQFRALDLGGAAGDPIRAARGGTVVMIRKDMMLNCMTQTCTQWGFPPGGMIDEYGNYVAVQHQGGSVGWYAHMIPGSSPLQLGERVKRGDFLGLMGNTGNSSGAHLHYHVTPKDRAAWSTTTDLVRYAAINLTDVLFEVCTIPVEGKIYQSTNRP